MPRLATDESRDFAEVRADKESAGFSGYAARFLIPDSHGSVFSRSSFNKTLRERKDRIPVLFNHDPDKIIGKATELRADGKGLRFDSRIAEDTFWGKEVMSLVRADILTGMSFGFRSIRERPGLPTDNIDLSAHRGAKPEEIRFIEEVRLKELSAVPFPSNESSQIDSYRSEDADEALEEIIENLRNLDLTSEQIERLTEELRSFADTHQEEAPITEGPVTLDEESRHKLELDIDAFLIEVDL